MDCFKAQREKCGHKHYEKKFNLGICNDYISITEIANLRMEILSKAKSKNNMNKRSNCMDRIINSRVMVNMSKEE
ncbi:MAG: hypothetical protein ACOZCL_17740 [Bacillota bacterium]